MKPSESSPAGPALSAGSQAGTALSASPSISAPTRAARAVRPRWLLLGLAVAIIFTDAVGYTVIIPALPSFAAELGLGETRTGTLYASYGLISLLLYLPFGLLVDRWGERRWLTAGMLALGLASLGFWQADGFWSLLGCRVTQGVAASATWAAALPLAARLATTERRGVEMSILMMAFSIGVVAGPALGSLGQLRDPFLYFAGVPFGLAVCAFALLPRRNPPQSPLLRGKRASAGGAIGSLGGQLSGALQNCRAVSPSTQVLAPSVARSFFRDGLRPELVCACLVILVTCAALGAIEILLPLQFSRLGWTRQHIGLFFSGWGLAMLIIQPLIGWWSDRRGRREPIQCGLLTAAVLTPSLFSALDSVWLFPLALGTIFALSAALVPTLPLMADYLTDGQSGRAFGFYNMAFSLGIVLGPWSGGYITERFDVLWAAILVSLPLLGMVPFVASLLRHPQPRKV